MDDFDQAIKALKAGRAIVFPTDTVYGLGVAVEYADTPQELFDLKRRDAGKPIAWLVEGPGELERLGRGVSSEALGLARRHWPGALTVIVNASSEVPPAYAPTGTVGLRMPAHDTALALVRAVGPIAASSANRAGDPPPHAAADLDRELCAEAAFVLRGEGQGSGIASTVVDATGEEPRILRQGGVDL